MKDFDGWNLNKKKLEETSRVFNFHEREIWWCSLGLNIGEEQDGKNELFERPVLVLKKFNRSICFAIPISSRIKTGFYYHDLELNGHISSLLLSQLRLVSTKRFRRLVRKISIQEFRIVKQKLVNIIQ